MDTANLTDKQVVLAVAETVVMPPGRVSQVLEAAGWFTLRDDVRKVGQAKKAGPAPKKRSKKK